MKIVVMLTKKEEVTHDPEKVAIIGEVEMDERGRFMQETFYFVVGTRRAWQQGLGSKKSRMKT